MILQNPIIEPNVLILKRFVLLGFDGQTNPSTGKASKPNQKITSFPLNLLLVPVAVRCLCWSSLRTLQRNRHRQSATPPRRHPLHCINRLHPHRIDHDRRSTYGR